MTSRPGGGGRGKGGGARPPPGHCTKYKFKGECEKRSNGELCPYRHDLPAEETEPDMTSRPGGRGRVRGGGARPPPGHCTPYKFTGKCEKRSKGDLCPYRHDLVAR